MKEKQNCPNYLYHKLSFIQQRQMLRWENLTTR